MRAYQKSILQFSSYNIGTYGHGNFLFLKPFQMKNRYMKACNFNRNLGLPWVCARMIMGRGILSSCLRGGKQTFN